MAKLNFPQLLLQSSVSHNPSEIIDNNTDDNKEMFLEHQISLLGWLGFLKDHVTGVKAALLAQE